MTWRELEPARLEREYNPRAYVGDPEPFFREFARASEQTRAELRHRLDIRYGPGPLETLDVFPAASASAPVHLFFHGGYWRSQDKRDYAFVARRLVPAGVTVVIANYDLCPAVTVAQIEAQALRCVDFVREHAAELGGDGGRLSVSGHSAGGQLAARVLAEAADAVTGFTLISGVFDLEPLPGTSINEALSLTAAEATARSPQYWPLPPAARAVRLVVGGAESAEFRRQTFDYAGRLREAGWRPRVEEIPGANHFTVLGAVFDDPDAGARLPGCAGPGER
jgi:arylformamidase